MVDTSDTGYPSPAEGGLRLRIEYSAGVLEEICAIAVDGLYRFRHGGIEVGGVLYGEHAADLVRILAFRPLNCEHAYGPRFVLSERDRTGLDELLDAPRHDPALRGLAPVGWYHSHTRSGIALSRSDLEIHDSRFRQPWQIALVLRPESYGAARAGFFHRHGELGAGASSREFVIARRRRVEPTTRDPEPPEQEPHTPLAAAAPGPEPSVTRTAQPPPERSRKWAWLMAALCLAAGGSYGVERYYRAESATPVSLWVAGTGRQLLIQWDRMAAPVRQARRGTLEIQDGEGRITVRMGPEQVREGSYAYTRRSEMVDVRLHLEVPRGGRAEELIRFLGPPVP